MKTLIKIGNSVFCLLVIMVLLAAIGTSITGRPFMLSVIRSYSMYPLLTRGDLVLLASVGPQRSLNVGDIVLFKTEEGSLASQGLSLIHILTI